MNGFKLFMAAFAGSLWLVNTYESEKLLGEYLLFHYGTAAEILPQVAGSLADALGFAERTVAHFSEGEVARALDVGCAVGRSTFELARQAREVIGIDFSHNFIASAERLREGKAEEFWRLEEGSMRTKMAVKAPSGVDFSRVRFEVGNATDLRKNLGDFDRVHAANLVCRLPEPRLFLRRLASLVKPSGELVLATPCTWLAEHTAREHWPEGKTRDWLQQELDADFDLVAECDEPFLIRETARKFQWTLSMVTKWRRRK